MHALHNFSLKYSVLLLVFAKIVSSNSTSGCERNFPSSYLDVAMDMIAKAKMSMPTYNLRPVDCANLLSMGHFKSGVYTIWPQHRLTEDKHLDVYCDMDTNGGGWTVIQRRGNFQRPSDYFYKDWKSYKEGFGDIQKDFWLGNDNIFVLSNQKMYSARIDLQDVDLNKRYAQYDTFWIDDESNKYMLHIADYNGDAGDSMTSHNNKKEFSTKDQDNDNDKDGNCAQKFKSGWWYLYCFSINYVQSNLNGQYVKGKHENSEKAAENVYWSSWKNSESLESTEIKIRPKKFRLKHVYTNTPQR